MVEKNRPEYIKLKKPEDVMAYVQRLINRIRRHDLELNPDYLGKITYLLNTWTSAFKAHTEYTEIKELQARIAALEQRASEQQAEAREMEVLEIAD